MIGDIATCLSIMAAIIAIAGVGARLTTYLLYVSGWGFQIVHVELSSRLVRRGDTIAFRVIVRNTGRRSVGTYYGIFKIMWPYDSRNPVHDTHRDLPKQEKLQLRVIDVAKDTTRDLTYEWAVPNDLPIGVYDLQVEIWNPHRLLCGPRPKRFDKATGDTLNFEVMQKESDPAGVGEEGSSPTAS